MGVTPIASRPSQKPAEIAYFYIPSLKWTNILSVSHSAHFFTCPETLCLEVRRVNCVPVRSATRLRKPPWIRKSPWLRQVLTHPPPIGSRKRIPLYFLSFQLFPPEFMCLVLCYRSHRILRGQHRPEAAAQRLCK